MSYIPHARYKRYKKFSRHLHGWNFTFHGLKFITRTQRNLPVIIINRSAALGAELTKRGSYYVSGRLREMERHTPYVRDVERPQTVVADGREVDRRAVVLPNRSFNQCAQKHRKRDKYRLRV